jgi:hypothetical protein
LNDCSTIGLQVAACCDKEHDQSRVYSEWQGNSPLAGTVVAVHCPRPDTLSSMPEENRTVILTLKHSVATTDLFICGRKNVGLFSVACCSSCYSSKYFACHALYLTLKYI